MNCDQAFDALTDTKLRDSIHLTQHLDQCPRCRDMADMLDPALDLFGDVVEADGEWESSSLTDSALENHTSSSEQPRSTDGQQRAHTRSVIPSRPWLNQSRHRTTVQQDGLRVAAFLTVIAVMMAAMVNVGRDSSSDSVAISLPESCQRNESTGSTADNVVAGCVACHLKVESLSSLQPMQKSRATQLVQQCVNCHLEMTTDHYLAELTTALPVEAESTRTLHLASCLFGSREG